MDSLTETLPASLEATRHVSALYQAHALALVRLAVLMTGDQPTAEDVVTGGRLSSASTGVLAGPA